MMHDIGLEKQLRVAAYISEAAESLITPSLSPPVLSFLYSPTNLPSSSPRHELFRDLYVKLAQCMYGSGKAAHQHRRRAGEVY